MFVLDKRAAAAESALFMVLLGQGKYLIKNLTECRYSHGAIHEFECCNGIA